jgi:hypothetical protein
VPAAGAARSAGPGHDTPGCPVAPTVLTVSDVPADEGFWATTSTSAVVWVQLVGDGESSIEIVADASVAIIGAVGNPASIGPIESDPRIAGGRWVVRVDFADITEG